MMLNDDENVAHFHFISFPIQSISVAEDIYEPLEKGVCHVEITLAHSTSIPLTVHITTFERAIQRGMELWNFLLHPPFS